MAVDTYFQLGDFKSSSHVVFSAASGNPSDKSLQTAAISHELLEIDEYNFGVTNAGGEPVFDSFTLTLKDSIALTSILNALANGQVLPTATLYLRKSSGGSGEDGHVFETVKLKYVTVSSVDKTVDNDNIGGTYTVKLNYGAISESYIPSTPMGGSATTVEADWDKLANVSEKMFASAATTLSLLEVSPARAGVFLNISGVTGASTVNGDAGWSEVESYSFGSDNTVGTIIGAGTGTGAGVGKLSSTLSLTLKLNAGTVALLKAAETGQPLKTLTLEAIKSSGQDWGSMAASDLTLGGVHVTSVQANHENGDGTTYTVSLSYDQVSLTNYDQKPDGTQGAASSFAWDMQANKAIDALPNASTTDKHAAAAVAAASDYYLQLSGIAGDTSLGIDQKSTWLKIDSHSFDILTGPSGKPPESSLNLHVSDPAGLTSLLTALSRGKTLSVATLVGVDGDRHVVETINLTQVLVTAVHQAGGVGYDGAHGYDLSLSYRTIAQSHAVQDATGAYASGNSFGLNLATGAAVEATGLVAAGQSVSPAAVVDYGATTGLFLKIAGVDGASQDANHLGWSNVADFAFGAEQSLAAPGTAAIKASFGTLDLTLRLDASTLMLLKAAETGGSLKGLTLERMKTVGNASVLQSDLTLAGVHVQSVTAASGDEGATYAVHLAYDQISLTDHETATASNFAWDVKTSVSADGLPNVSSKAAGAIMPVATTYYLHIEGVHGDTALSIDPKGTWLAVGSYTLDTEAGASGRLGLSSLNLSISTVSGLADALAALGKGTILSKATLVGVADGNGNPHVVETIDLSKVAVTAVDVSHDNEVRGYDLSLRYATIVHTHAVQDANGRYDGSVTTGIDLTTGAQITPTGIVASGQSVQTAGATEYENRTGGIFLKIAGVTGETFSLGHVGWSEVQAYTFGASNSYDVATKAAGKPHFDTLDMTLKLDTSEVALFKAALNGQTIKTLMLDTTHSSSDGSAKAQDLTSHLVLQGVHVTSLTQSHNDESPFYTVSVSFDQIDLTEYYARSGETELSNAATFSGTLSTNTYTSSPVTDGQVDVFAPTVTTVAAEPDRAGPLGIDHTVTFTVTLSEKVALSAGGTAVLHLSNGVDLTTDARRPSADPTSLSFTYTVGGDHDTTDLVVDSLSLGTGTTLKDGTGHAAVLDFTPIDTHLVIDTTTAVSVALANDTTPDLPGSPLGADHVTKDATLIGAGEAGSTVTVFRGAAILGTTQVGTDGTWHFTPTLKDGHQTLTVSETDAAGNTATATLDLTLDTRAPATPVVSLANGVPTTGGLVSRDANLAITGREAGATLHYVTDQSPSSTTYVRPTTDGAHTVTIEQWDLAGNYSVAATVAFTLDTAAPAAPTGLTNAAIRAGYVDAAHDTSDQALTGTAEAGSTVTVYDSMAKLGTVTADAGGAWTYTLGHLFDGNYSLTATAMDAAGNVGPASAALAFVVDTQVPGAPGLALAHDTGISANDHVTRDPALLATPAVSGDTLSYVLDGGTASASLPQLAVDGSADGAHTVTVIERSAAGNASAATTLSFALDTQAPVAPTLALAHDTGTSSKDRITSDASLTVATTEAIGTLAYTVDGKAAAAYDPKGLADGTHTVSVMQTDAAGNVSDAGSVAFTLDRTAPTVSVTAPTQPVKASSPAGAAVSFAAATADAVDGTDRVLFTEDGKAVRSGQVFAPGDHMILASAIDAAGNTANAFLGFTVVVPTLKGKAVDGYLAGATVFADANGNGQLDPGEVSTTTDASGTFTLTGGSGTIVTLGGTDVSTGLAFAGSLRAPAGSTVVTPLTTVAVALAAQGVADPVGVTKAAFGLSGSFDLINADPIAGSASGDATALAVLKAGAAVADTLTLIASALKGAGVTDASADAAAIASLTSHVASQGTIDLTSKAVITALAVSTGLSADVADTIGAVAAVSNTKLSVATDADAVGALQHIAQGSAAAAIQAAGADPGKLTAIDGTYAAIDHAPVLHADAVSGTGLSAALTGNVLANDADASALHLDSMQFASSAAVSVPAAGTVQISGAHGTLTISSDGSFSYQPTSAGHDAFTETVMDAAGNAGQTTLSFDVDHASSDAFRFYDTKTGGHFFTASANEAAEVRASLPSFVQEGTSWVTPDKGTDTVDVFRFFDTKTGDHFYTNHVGERDGLIAGGSNYHYEGIAFEAYVSEGASGTTALERFYNVQTGQHHYALAGEAEGIRHGSAGANWVDEGKAFVVHLVSNDFMV